MLPSSVLLFPGALSAAAQSTLSQSAADLAAQAEEHYEAGEFTAAAQLFEQAATVTADPWQQAALLSNASLAHQQQGNWDAAQDTIQAAQQVISPQEDMPETLAIAAQVQDIAARLLFSQGDVESAAVTWETAAIAYEQSGNRLQSQQAQLSQAQALQAAGFYRRSVDLLSKLAAALAAQSPNELAVRVSLSLGEAFRLTGAFTDAERQLQRGLQLAQAVFLPDQISTAYRSLGDLVYQQGLADSSQTARAYYDQAIAAATSPLVQMQARLARLRLWIAEAQWQSAYDESLLLWNARTTLPPERAGLYVQIDLIQQLQVVRQAIADTLSDANPVPEVAWYVFVQEVFADELNTLRRGTTSTFSRALGDSPLWHVIDKHFPPLADVAAHLRTLLQAAQDLGDTQAEATTLGVLGNLYEQVEDWEAALQLTQEGLILAQSYSLGQVAYELQAQLGRIQLAQGDRTAAIEAYQASVQTLQDLRADVVAVSSEAQYSFQQSIEPIYRDLAALLLAEDTGETSEKNLQQAREVIELLQLAELDNFFREACLNAKSVAIDQIDTRAAVLYPILLPDRLDVVVSLPDDEFQHFPVAVEPEMLAQTLQTLKLALEDPQSDIDNPRGLGIQLNQAAPLRGSQLRVLPLAAQLYDWLIRPAESLLEAANIETLVFVLDGSLRSVPMSVLYDGSQFLIEKYAIALTPGLQLLDPRPLPRQELSVIVGGLSEVGESPEATRFPALPNVEQELDTIEQSFPSVVMLNQEFSVDNFTSQVGTLPAPVVHLATHGQFGSNLEDTFVLAWDDSLDANRFSNILLTSELSRGSAIELLVLSACETATGDDLAVLGLAGIAMRSGARSTLASLWQVSDLATAELMGEFYRQLGNAQITKAEAIRQAQLTLLENRRYRHPFFWSAFVLVGNWL
ncbi:MAG: CHAT domain-containing protein [Leptolyngbyaceae cyanobacterium]